MPHFVADRAEFAALGRGLLEELLPLPQPIRLMGLTLSALEGEKSHAPEGPEADGGQLSLL